MLFYWDLVYKGAVCERLQKKVPAQGLNTRGSGLFTGNAKPKARGERSTRTGEPGFAQGFSFPSSNTEGGAQMERGSERPVPCSKTAPALHLRSHTPSAFFAAEAPITRVRCVMRGDDAASVGW